MAEQRIKYIEEALDARIKELQKAPTRPGPKKIVEEHFLRFRRGEMDIDALQKAVTIEINNLIDMQAW